MKVSRTTAYAIQALLELATSDKEAATPCSALARRHEMPERFLLQVLHKLVLSGIVRSVRGVDGGYLLARPTTSISLLDIYETLGESVVAETPPVPVVGKQSKQQLHRVLSDLTDLVRSKLAQTTLADLL